VIVVHVTDRNREGINMISSTIKTGVDRTQYDESGVRSVVDGIGKAWESNNADAFADAYTEDGSMILSGDRYLSGREVIRAVVTQQFKSVHQGTTLLQNIVDLRFLTHDVAVVITEGGVLTLGEVKPAPERAIRATWGLTKENNAWLSAAYRNTRRADAQLPGA
jgi:uncharacterized protein (TIGR02246 family)